MRGRLMDHTATIAGMDVTPPAMRKAIAAPGRMPCSSKPETDQSRERHGESVLFTQHAGYGFLGHVKHDHSLDHERQE